MKRYSIARRVVTLSLLMEVLSAVCMTGFVFLYERQTHFHSLDVALRGRADTLMGAVIDAEDNDDRVVLDMEGIAIPAGDLYEVWDNRRTLLGRSPGWTAPAVLLDSTRQTANLRVHGSAYRAVRITGLRRVDPDTSGVRHDIVTIYASPTLPAWLPVFHAVRAFALASSLLVALSAVLVTLLVRRSMTPLAELAAQAGAISSSRWRFQPPDRARHTEELLPLTAALEDLVRRLQISFAQQRQFVGDSAHELKTAVTVIKSSLQLLELRARSAEDYRAGVIVSLSDCQRLEDLVQRMITLARVEEGGRPVSEGPCPMAELHRGVMEAILSLESLTMLRRVRLEYSGPSAVQADIAAEDWQTLCTNLLLNAVQHSSAGSRILVALSKTGDRVVCSFMDHGAGIAAEALPHVFDRFYRGDASRARATGGSGLGLAICKAIVERAGGSISIASKLGEGTIVTVELVPVEGLVEPGSGMISASDDVKVTRFSQ